VNIKRRIAAIAGSCAVLVGLSAGVAQAAGGASFGIPFAYQNVRGVSVLPVTFTAGDCRQTGLNQTPNLPASLVEMQAPQDGQTWVKWRATLYTVSSHSGDVWHAKFVFRNSGGGTVLTVTMDGDQMWPGTRYFTNVWKQVNLTQAQWDSIAFSDWYGDC
jgi:hypothetical protein